METDFITKKIEQGERARGKELLDLKNFDIPKIKWSPYLKRENLFGNKNLILKVDRFKDGLLFRGKEMFISGIKEKITNRRSVKFENYNFLLCDKAVQDSVEFIEIRPDYFDLETERPNIMFSLSLENEKYYIKATTSIVKDDPGKVLPSAMVDDIYPKMFDLIQYKSEVYNKKIYHEIIHSNVGPKNAHISREKWDKIFVPLLEKQNYIPADRKNGLWYKEYLPTNNLN